MNKKSSLWSYIKNYKFHSIFIRNFCIIMLLVILPILGICIMVYNFYNDVMKEEISAVSMNSLTRVRDVMDMITTEVNNESLWIAFDKNDVYYKSDIRNFLTDLRPETINFDYMMMMNRIENLLSSPNLSKRFVNSVYLYSEKNQYLLTSNFNAIKLDYLADYSWLEEYEEKKDKVGYWTSVRNIKNSFTDGNSYKAISVFRTVPLNDEVKTGVVIINIDIEKIGRLINNVSNNYIENIYIADNDGVILYNRDRSIVGKNIRDIGSFKNIDFSGKMPVVNSSDTMKEAVLSVTSQLSGWKCISVIPLDLYQEKNIYLQRYMIVLTLIGIVIAGILAFFISINAYRPIGNIISVLENPEDWYDMESVSGRTRLDEFKFIASNIIKSYGQQKNLENELAYRMMLLKKAQSVALQSQINPHFLNNTLESINWKAIRLMGGGNPVSGMISSLSELLKISLETTENLIPIFMEIEHASRYLEIQKNHYNDKFDVSWNIDKEILDYRICKITLQPLIENAIYHGIKPKDCNGVINIIGHTEDSDIVIVVADDGVGMEPEKIREINSDLESDNIREDKHIGIGNVNDRIRLTFGDRYGLTLTSDVNKGTTVKILIPKVK